MELIVIALLTAVDPATGVVTDASATVAAPAGAQAAMVLDGVTFTSTANGWRVTSVTAETPLSGAVAVGDMLVEVNGAPVDAMTAQGLVGDGGTTVSLKLIGADGNPKEIELKR